jgi:EamA domain-containing membrane protein RarD
MLGQGLLIEMCALALSMLSIVAWVYLWIGAASSAQLRLSKVKVSLLIPLGAMVVAIGVLGVFASDADRYGWEVIGLLVFIALPLIGIASPVLMARIGGFSKVPNE